MRLDRRAPEFENPARKPHAAPAIAQIALDLSGYVRHREGRELAPALHLEAVDGLDQADASNLVEIVVVVGGA